MTADPKQSGGSLAEPPSPGKAGARSADSWERIARYAYEVREAEAVADTAAADRALEDLMVKTVPPPDWAEEEWPGFTNEYKRYYKAKVTSAGHLDPMARYNAEKEGRGLVKERYNREVLGLTEENRGPYTQTDREETEND